ncbi:MAG: DUF4350 domain-containing protein [Pseudomonadota bacterium]|nr:DUF4350 domain-containing protein [Pseudomonadota bacterium]
MTSAASNASGSAFHPATILWALCASVVMALAFVGVATFAPELREHEGGGADALSRSAVGYAVLVQLLRATGVPVQVRRSAATLEGAASLLVLAPPPGADAEAVRTAAAYKGAVLIIAPKWLASPAERHPGWISVHGLIPPESASAAVTRPEIDHVQRATGQARLVVAGSAHQHIFSQTQTLDFGDVDRLQSRASDNGSPLLQDAAGRVVLVGVRSGNLYVLTDPDLVNNHGLGQIESARSALALINRLREGDGPVVFDVTLNGFSRPRSLLRTALTPPFFAATLCAMIAFALIGWRAATRFGPAARPGRAVALGKLALVDNAAGLLRLTRREARMAPRYAGVVRNALAQAVGAPRDWSPQQVDEYLDKLGDPSRQTKPFSDLVAQADRSSGNLDVLMQSARQLFKWKSEITRGRR